MEENILEVGEEKIDLNSNEKEFTQESELASPLKNKMYTKEEVELIKKEMSRNAEKGVQKLICENKLLKEALKELGYIAERSERLLELHEEKPDISEIILRDYFEETIDEYIERTGVLDEYKNALDLKKRIEKEALKMTEDKIFQIEKLKFQNKLGMDEEENKKLGRSIGNIKKVSEDKTRRLGYNFGKCLSNF